MPDTTASPAAHADREKRLVALSSVLAAVLLTSLKVVVGVLTGSLGILSEAAHSGLDLVAAVITFWAVHMSGKPADREHTYGHGKFENLSALAETLLLLLTCVWIFYEVVRRLFFAEVHVDASPWAFVVMAVSIAVDFGRSRALARVAKKYNSQALEADALHFSTDIWSSSVVIGGLAFVLLSEKLGIPWLAKADAVAAAGVACIVVWVSLRLGKKTIDDLLDAVPADFKEKVEAAARVPGVLDVLHVRVRRSGPETFADVTVAVARDTAFEKAHDLADTAEQAIKAAIPGTDVVVHVEPVASGKEGQLTTIRLLASRHGMGAHAIRIYEEQGRLSLELHLEVDEALRLGEAHERVSTFEQALRGALPGLDRVTSHIEPTGDRSAKRSASPDDERPVRQALERLCHESGVRFVPHDVKVQRVGEELAVSFHCAMDAEVSIAAAHELTEKMEKQLRERVPTVGRVTIHVEPPEEPTVN